MRCVFFEVELGPRVVTRDIRNNTPTTVTDIAAHVDTRGMSTLSPVIAILYVIHVEHTWAPVRKILMTCYS